MKTIISAIILASLVQMPLAYFFVSLESLTLGHGFIGSPSGTIIYLIAVCLVSAMFILLVSLPSYFALKRIELNSMFYLAAAGFVIPVLILFGLEFAIADDAGFSAGENYYGTYRSTFVSGRRTFWGWIKFLEQLVTYGIHGAIGAAVFHKVMLKGSHA